MGQDVLGQPRRHVLMHAADAEIIGVHAGAGHALIELHQDFPLLEAPQHRGHGAHVHALGGDVEKMVEQAGNLAEQHPDVLAPGRHLQAQQAFGGEYERVLLAHHRDVIQAVEVGDRLHVRLVLDQLFGAAMQQPDVGIGALYHFAVQFQH